MKYIQRKSSVKVNRIEGSIVNTTNIKDKKKNTYSAEVIDELLGGAGWNNASINTDYLSGGTIRYAQIGKLVIVQFLDIIVGVSIDANELPLITGLPVAKNFTPFILQGTDGTNNDLFRMVIANDQTIVKSWYSAKSVKTNMMYYGSLYYFTK